MQDTQKEYQTKKEKLDDEQETKTGTYQIQKSLHDVDNRIASNPGTSANPHVHQEQNIEIDDFNYQVEE